MLIQCYKLQVKKLAVVLKDVSQFIQDVSVHDYAVYFVAIDFMQLVIFC